MRALIRGDQIRIVDKVEGKADATRHRFSPAAPRVERHVSDPVSRLHG
jgi:hypothetical protein